MFAAMGCWSSRRPGARREKRVLRAEDGFDDGLAWRDGAGGYPVAGDRQVDDAGGFVPEAAGGFGVDFAGFRDEAIPIAVRDGHAGEYEAARGMGFKGLKHRGDGPERFEIHDCSAAPVAGGLGRAARIETLHLAVKRPDPGWLADSHRLL